MTSQTRVSEQSLLALKQIAKILYEDEAYVILNYIISRREQQFISESDMVDKLNLPFSVVRKNLLMLEKHGILLQSEHKRHYEENDFSNNNNQNYQHTRFQNRRNKSMDWRLNDTFYNNLQARFNNLKIKLNEKLDQRKEVNFICEKCESIYSIQQGVLNNNKCEKCIDHPKLIEKGGEDVTELKKKCNELINDLSIIFNNNSNNQFARIGPINSNNRHYNSINNTNNNNFEVKFPDNKNNNDPIVNKLFDPLGDPVVNELLKNVKKDKKKYEDFCNFIEYFNAHK